MIDEIDEELEKKLVEMRKVNGFPYYLNKTMLLTELDGTIETLQRLRDFVAKTK